MSKLSDAIEIADHTVMSVRRPNGDIEQVRKDGGMSDAAFAKIKAATKAAGRGDLLSYTVIMRTTVVAGYAAAVTAERADDASKAAIYRAMGAEVETDPVDRTPAHPTDL